MTLIDYTELAPAARYDLWLNFSPEDHRVLPWAIRDGAHDDQVMCRTGTFTQAVVWMQVFSARTPGTSVCEESIRLERERAAVAGGFSVRVDGGLAPVVRITDRKVVA